MTNDDRYFLKNAPVRLAKLSGAVANRRNKQATVRVGTRKPLVLRGRKLRPAVDLRGLPKGTFRVRIDVTTTSGRTLTVTRKYRTCTPRKGGRK